MKKLVALMVIALMAVPTVTLAGFSARGDFNSWGLSPMAEVSGVWSIDITGLAANASVKYKVDEDPPGDWSNAFPKEDAWTKADGSGDVTISFDTNVISDGWDPASNRVLAPDPGDAWEVLGDFTSWDVSPVAMAGPVGGVYSVDITVASAGAHQFKFRAPGDWGRQIGDFTGSGNIEFSLANPNVELTFELDVPNGRWRVTPEPATLALLGLGAMAIVRRRR